MAWQTPKTDWAPPDGVTDADLNRIEGNIQELQNTKETPDGAQAKVDTHEAKAAPHSGHETPDGAQAKVNTHANTKATLAQLGHVNHSVLTTTLNTTWQGSEAPYTKTQTVNGLLATDTPIVDVVMSGTFATDEARQEAWAGVYRITTADNAITLYATEKPAVELPIQLKVVR